DQDPPPVLGAVVFIHPNVQLELKDASVPVLTASKLKSWFRSQTKKRALKERQRLALEAAIRQ
ncbi:MAG: hypothetical protein J7M34_06500, partial [Anaerolineae bacterium]|nr:hypothetical protein [Anaerolineae bacterium]